MALYCQWENCPSISWIESMILPEHMTVWDRNQRIYETLKVMGLHTEVVLCRDDQTKIDQIVVAAAPPTVILQVAECSTQTSISAPMQGTQVVGSVGATQRQGDNVIHFPAIL